MAVRKKTRQDSHENAWSRVLARCLNATKPEQGTHFVKTLFTIYSF
ncbi:MAG: PD-(D/E)XK nuclease family protein [Slackia sp.]|nr:PD-(D/E)XK nuclease family protein [Slackia sp.]